jgi:hypothetical protein
MFKVGLIVMVWQLGQMDQNMRENLEMDNLMDKVVVGLRMEIFTLVNIGTVIHMVKVPILGVLASGLETSTLEGTLTIKDMDKAPILLVMAWFKKVFSPMTSLCMPGKM